jgi:hypothetical protein
MYNYTTKKARIGDTFHTGQTCPESGVYEFASHTSVSSHVPTAGERTIPLVAGKTFPPCRGCTSGVIWKLKEYA